MSTTAAGSPRGNEVQDPANLVELAALERMIRRSAEFRIAFAVANHPTLRTRLIRAVRRDLPDFTIVELTVPDAPAEIISAIEAAAQPPPGAVFVLGLDELKSDNVRSRVIADLNVNRDYLSRTVSVPVVLWASDFAFRGFAQQAADLWAGRSGMYRFRAEGNDFASTIADITDRVNWGPNPDDRRERERLLEDLLDESGDDTKNRALVLVAFGNGASVQSHYDEAREFYEQALTIYRDIGDRTGEASTLRSLGGTASAQSRFSEARELYDQALAIYRDIGDQTGEASILDSLAGTAGEQSHYYAERALPTQRAVGLPERRIVESADSGRGTLGTRVFLSYASEDRTLASKVHEWLVDAGCQVFLDQDLRDGIAVGEGWGQRLYERLRWADAVVCVVTRAYLASVWCTAEVSLALSRGSRVLPVRAEPGVDHPLLGSAQYADITKDPAAGRAALVEALRRIDAAGGRGWSDDRSPFPGLRPFDVDEHRVFFGRRSEVAQLAGLLRSPAEQAVLLVVGPSGCGKSSLVRAGLLPMMAAEPDWLALSPMLPGTDPVAALARELAVAGRQLGLSWTVTEVWHRLDHGELAGLADELLLAARARRLLLVVDQFEELLTQSMPGERARFARLLRPALGTPVQVVATLRPEFLEQLLLDTNLAVLPTRTYTLRPLHREALRTVIEGPAQFAGIEVDEDLVARLVADTDSGEALPLLAFTLAQLAEGISRGGHLSSARYDQLGGVRGALTRQADAALVEAMAVTGRSREEVTGRSREEVIAGLLRLVTVDEQGRPIRWRVPREELPEPVTRELDAFITRRLVITDTENDRMVVGVAHEAFLSAWAPLAKAIEDNASALRARRAVEQAATEWDTEGRPVARLWERGQLAAALADTGARTQAGDLITDRVDLSPTARFFLQTSIRRDRVRRGRTITVLSMLLALAVLTAGFAVIQQRAAEHQRDIALSQRVASQSLELRTTNPALAAQLGLAAYRLASTTEARSSLLSALATPYSTQLTGYTAAVTSVAFRPDGHTLATGSADRTVRLWDVSNPHHPILLGTLVGNTDTVTLVAFSPDGHTLATGSADKTVRLWDVSDPHHPSPLSTLTGHTAAVTSVAFSPDGHTLATASYDNTVRLWDISDPHHPTLLGIPLSGYTNTVTSVVFSPDGHTLATGSADKTVRLWDVSNLRQPHPLDTLIGYTGSVTGVVFSPDGHTLATASADDTVRLWDLPGPILAGHTAAVTSVAFSPDGRTLATGSEDYTVRLWDISNPGQPHPLSTLTGYTATFTSVAFSPDGHILAAGSADKTVRLWDISNPHQPHELGTLTGHTAAVTSVAFSPDGHTLATGSDDNTARLWGVSDPHQPHLLAILTGHVNSVMGVAFSPDGHTLATASADRTLRLWDISNPHQPHPLSTLTGHTATVTSVAFSPDAHTLATGSADRTIRLWDISDPHQPHPLSTLTGHTATVTSVAFSRDGRTLATGSYDNTVRLWEINNPHQPYLLAILTGNTGSVMGVAFSPDGHTLATANIDTTARLWDTNVDSVAAQICSVTPTITKSEWAQYLPGLPYQPPCP